MTAKQCVTFDEKECDYGVSQHEAKSHFYDEKSAIYQAWCHFPYMGVCSMAHDNPMERRVLTDDTDDYFQFSRPFQREERLRNRKNPYLARKNRRKQIEKNRKKSVNYNQKTSKIGISGENGCNWSFVFDPSGRLAYWWSLMVSVAFVYNLWTIAYR